MLTAERARAKAEARRQRILSKAGQRLDVVSGLAPIETVVDYTTAAAQPVAISPTNNNSNDFAVSGVDSSSPTGASTPGVGAAVAVSDAEKESTGGAGSKRMSAMRRRRYQHKAQKAKEEERDAETATNNDDVVAAEGGATAVHANETVKENEEVSNVPEEKITNVSGSNSKLDSEPTPAEAITEASSPPPKTKEVHPDTPEPSSPAMDEKKESDESSSPSGEPKKYMGVARMRRKMLKDQKAQRIKELDEKLVDTVGVDAAAEMAAMTITASMVREGSGVDASSNLSSIAVESVSKKRQKNKWYLALFPPMHLVPRMVTMALLLMFGMDMGLEPYRRSLNTTTSSDDSASRSVMGVSPLIGHLETSITKPWEYGMGGKVAYMVGMAPSAPPTAMPTSFLEGFCAFDIDGEECLAQQKNSDIDNSVKKPGIMKRMFSMEDEFDSSRASSMTADSTVTSGNARPRGVSHDDSEFDDTSTNNQKEPNIDPLFQVDFDALLENAQLPLPLDWAARLAIGFHRAWVYYLWTLPLSTIKSVIHFPKNLLSGWMTNPPIVFFICLFVRLVNKILLGGGPKSFSLDSGGDNSVASGKSKGGGNKLDVLGTVMDTAKNYVSDKFPRTILVLGTLKDVVKIDMYVVFCGMLVGLVLPQVGHGPLLHGLSSFGFGGSVLGDGEL